MIQRINITQQQYEELCQLKLFITPDGAVIKLPANIIQDLHNLKQATVWYMPINSNLPTTVTLKVEL